MKQQLDKEIAALYPSMMKFARLHLKVKEDVEDAVQEAALALLTCKYEGRSSFKTYAFSILKFKIMDRLRNKYQKEVSVGNLFVVDESDDFDVLFNASGKWAEGEMVSAWATPGESLQSNQFLEVLDICLNNMPEKVAEVFSLVEVMGNEADEVCDILKMSKASYWQSMSRARKILQMCLTKNWFAKEVV